MLEGRRSPQICLNPLLTPRGLLQHSEITLWILVASVPKQQVMIFLSQHRRKERAKYEHFPDHRNQFGTICSLLHSFLQVLIVLGSFCLFLWCILSCNFCSFSEEIQLEPFDSFSVHCPFIFSLSLPLFPYLSSSPPFSFPPLHTPPLSFPLFFHKHWIREAVKLEKIRTGVSSGKLFLFSFCLPMKPFPTVF